MVLILRKYFSLVFTGGILYTILELVWRGQSHWTMFLLGGLCFVVLGLINEILPLDMPLWQQVLIGAAIITALEFLTGCIINLLLGWNVWDYSKLPGNILGQICPLYCLLWLPVSLAGIVLDDWLRYWWWGERKPKYRII
ncbi:MAG: putative ABC transporter permease [Clostridiales bacterium]|nr:putative ABC transporter permease [Clostridiales bacterium]